MRSLDSMLFYSTNHQSPAVSFEDALIGGLAPDGGLYMPQSFPRFTPQEIVTLHGKSLPEIGVRLFQKWFGDEIPAAAMEGMIKQSLNFPLVLKHVGPFQVLELFHGPTLAFKDIAASCLAHLMDYFLAKQKRKTIVLVATSGDTGGAVAQGFGDKKNITVVILYPKGKVSKLQEQQLTHGADNIYPLEVEGVFDDCQRLVKEAFVDSSLRRLHLTSANSINIGRLTAQMLSYIYTYCQLQIDTIRFIVPSGNMGNVTAGLFAAKMGFPFSSFIIATNENDPVVKYFQTGIFTSQPTIPTLSNAMDIGNPSNFIRILELFKNNHAAFKKTVHAIKISEPRTIATIKRVYQKYNYLLDPHTAVAWATAEQSNDTTHTNVIMATASPLKFSSEINRATGITVDDSVSIKNITSKNQRKYSLRNSYQEFKEFLNRLLQ